MEPQPMAAEGENSNEGQFQPHGGAFLLSQDSHFNFSQLSQGFSDRLEQMTMGRPGQSMKASSSLLGPSSQSMSEAPFTLHQIGNSALNGNSNLSASSQVSSQGSDSFMMLTSAHHEDSLLSYPTDNLPTPVVGIACGAQQTTLMSNISTSGKIPINTNSGLSIQTDQMSFSVPGPPSSKAVNIAVKPKTQKNILPTTVETERQVDLRAVTPNPFLQYNAGPLVYNYPGEDYFQRLVSTTSLMNSLPKLSKIWISPFEERSRYTTEFEECAQIGTGTFSRVSCVRNR